MTTQYVGGGRFQIIKRLGAGSFAQTYLAKDLQQFNHKCVVKQLQPLLSTPETFTTAKNLFEREAKALYELGRHHDQIPYLLGYFQENQQFYLVQEFIEGHDLAEELTVGKQLPESQVIALLESILEPLAFLHRQKVIHRDIKPTNLIRRQKDGKMVLIDFGAIKELVVTEVVNSQGKTRVETIIGTPGYMPTEQSRGRAKLASDVYAVGIIGIQALTGLIPQDLEEDPDTGELVWHDKIKVSSGLRFVLEQMVHYHFKKRYPSAIEALMAMQQLKESYGTGPENVNPNCLPSIKSTCPETLEETSSNTKALSSLQQLKKSYGTDSENINPNYLPTLIPTSEESYQPFTYPQTPEETSKSTKKSKTSWLNLLSLLAFVGLGGLFYAKFPELNSQIISKLKFVSLNQESISPSSSESTIEKDPFPETLKSYLDAKKYSECISEAQNFAQENFKLSPEVEKILGQCQLAQAQTLADNGKFKDAVNLAAEISPEHPVYQQTQQLIGQWSERMWELAKEQYQAGKLETSVYIAKAIPKYHAPTYEKAQQAAKEWPSQWQTNESNLQAAQVALKQEKWQVAINEANKLTTPYWQQQAQPVIQTANQKLRQVALQKQKQTKPRQQVSPSKKQKTATKPKSRYPVPADLRWINARNGYAGVRPVQGGTDNGRNLYVCRAIHRGDWTVGKLVTSHGRCYVAWGGKEYGYNTYQVLQGSNFKWIRLVNSIPTNAVRAGIDKSEYLYSCLAAHDGELTSGKYLASHRSCYVPWGGKEHQKKTNIYILTINR